jgi:hypothetical protein
MRLAFGQKIHLGLLAFQFLGHALLQNEKNKKIKLTNQQIDYISNEILKCETYQNLIKAGKSPEQITAILELFKINKEKFENLTNKSWPL